MGLKARGTRPAVCHQQLLRPAALVGLSKIFDSGTNSNLYHSLDSLAFSCRRRSPAAALLLSTKSISCGQQLNTRQRPVTTDRRC